MQKREFSLLTFDNIPLYACEWSPEAQPTAAIILLHGLGEHSQRYTHVAQAFTDAGYSFFAFDLRGHGRSPGLRGDFPSFEAVMKDIDSISSIVAEKYPQLPSILYGHSLGGLLVLYYVLSQTSKISGVIATGPGLRMAVDPSALKIKVGRTMMSIRPTLDFSNDIDRSGLSRDKTVVSAYIADPLVHDRVTARLGIEGLDTGKWVLDNADKLSLPLLLMQGTADRIVNPRTTRLFAEKLDGRTTYKEWDGYYHELHNEPEKDQVIQYMLDWIKNLNG
jgi:acylglycerol lipase